MGKKIAAIIFIFFCTALAWVILGASIEMRTSETDTRLGEEVVQLYARAVEARKGAPIRQLRGFERVRLAAGEQRRVAFALVPERDLARYDEARKAFTVEPGEFEIEVGASSRDLRLRTRVSVE